VFEAFEVYDMSGLTSSQKTEIERFKANEASYASLTPTSQTTLTVDSQAYEVDDYFTRFELN